MVAILSLLCHRHLNGGIRRVLRGLAILYGSCFLYFVIKLPCPQGSQTIVQRGLSLAYSALNNASEWSFATSFPFSFITDLPSNQPFPFFCVFSNIFVHLIICHLMTVNYYNFYRY